MIAPAAINESRAAPATGRVTDASIANRDLEGCPKLRAFGTRRPACPIKRECSVRRGCRSRRNRRGDDVHERGALRRQPRAPGHEQQRRSLKGGERFRKRETTAGSRGEVRVVAQKSTLLAHASPFDYLGATMRRQSRRRRLSACPVTGQADRRYLHVGRSTAQCVAGRALRLPQWH